MTSARPQLHLLGGFRLLSRGDAVAVPESAGKLIALLAINEGPLARSRIAGSLCPEQSEARALANLRALVWRLPAHLCAVLRVDGTTMAIADDVDVDVHRAREIVRDLLSGTITQVPSQAHVALLSRPLLPDWDADWLTFERERTRQLHIHALEAWGNAMLAAGDALSAVDLSISVVGAEPLRESAHVLLVNAYLACGNRADAHRSFERYRELMRRELDLDPVVEWTDLLASTSSRRAPTTMPCPRRRETSR